MPYKVLQIIDKLDIGGAEKITVLLANLMAEKGHDSGLLTLIDAGKLIENLDNNVKYINRFLNGCLCWHNLLFKIPILDLLDS